MEVCELIQRLPDDGAFEELRNRADLYDRGLVVKYLRRVEDLRTYGPNRSMHLAEWGLRATSRLRKRGLSSRDSFRTCSLASRTWAAYRLAIGDFAGTVLGLKTAARFLVKGSPKSESLDLACQIAIYFRSRRRFDCAREWADTARRIADRDPRLRARALLCRGGVVGDFYPEEAVKYLRRAQKLKTCLGPNLAFGVDQALAVNLIESGLRDPNLVESLIEAAGNTASRPIHEAHFRWLRSKFHSIYGRHDLAMSDLNRCVQIFEHLCMLPHAAISGLDLATKCLELGRFDHAAAFAREVAPILGVLFSSGEELIATRTFFISLQSGQVCNSAMMAVRTNLKIKAAEL